MKGEVRQSPTFNNIMVLKLLNHMLLLGNTIMYLLKFHPTYDQISILYN